jgi:hypothetical protein
MSNTVLGNKQEYTFYQDYHEVELDDDEWIELEGELVDGESIVGFRDVCPEASDSTTVQIGFYYKPPDSEWYWDYEYGQPYKPIVPVVFSVASNGNLLECLNQSFTEVDLELLEEDWIVMNVTLKRKLIQNENIFFGVYSDCVGVTGIDFADADSTWSFYYFSFARRNDYNSAIAYVSSQAFIAQSRKMDCDYCPIIYLEYVNGENGSAYTRTVLGNVGAVAANGRNLFLKRSSVESSALNTIVFNQNHFSRSYSENKNLTSSNENRIIFSRGLEIITTLTTSSYRALKMKIEKLETPSFSDSLYRLLSSIRSCFSSSRLSDDMPLASRVFYRTAISVMSLWDWLRGKIRIENNVLTLFCPITTEIKLECRI